MCAINYILFYVNLLKQPYPLSIPHPCVPVLRAVSEEPLKLSRQCFYIGGPGTEIKVWHVMRQMSQVYVTGLACDASDVTGLCHRFGM